MGKGSNERITLAIARIVTGQDRTEPLTLEILDRRLKQPKSSKDLINAVLYCIKGYGVPGNDEIRVDGTLGPVGKRQYLRVLGYPADVTRAAQYLKERFPEAAGTVMTPEEYATACGPDAFNAERCNYVRDILIAAGFGADLPSDINGAQMLVQEAYAKFYQAAAVRQASAGHVF